MKLKSFLDVCFNLKFYLFLKNYKARESFLNEIKIKND
jgi:hypothetical protein